MTLTTAQQVRLKIQDLPERFIVESEGDGRASSFNVARGAHVLDNITSATAFVYGSDGTWSATGATFNVSGYVTFSGVVPANSAYRLVGVWSVFSDDYISHITAVGGSVNGAALEAITTLMFDGLKRAKWAAPDGSTYDDTAALGHLKSMYSALKEEVADAESVNSDYQSWTEGQADWGW